MKLVLVFVVTFYCLYQHVNANGNSQNNQQSDDPTKPFWATRGRRSGRHSIKADDDIPEKWADYEYLPETTMDKESPKDAFLHKRDRDQQTANLLQSLLNALSSSPWDGEVMGTRQNERKRGDPKKSDPDNPFWASRG